MKKRYLKKNLSQIRTSLLSTSTFAASGPLCMYIYIYNNIFISLDQYFFFFFSSHVRELINIYIFFYYSSLKGRRNRRSFWSEK